jgi:hypothetical protein
MAGEFYPPMLSCAHNAGEDSAIDQMSVVRIAFDAHRFSRGFRNWALKAAGF